MTSNGGASAGTQQRHGIAHAESIATDRGWIPAAPTRALYASAGRDTRTMTFLHPRFLAAQGAPEIPAPSFLVYVDKAVPIGPDHVALEFDDGETRVATEEIESLDVDGFDAHLLAVQLESRKYGPSRTAVLRIRGTNGLLHPASPGSEMVGDRSFLGRSRRP